MTCFWDGVIASLDQNDFAFIGEIKSNVVEFIKMLKRRSIKMENVMWQNKIIKGQELDEHLVAITEYNIQGIRSGHLTSVCDSFLLLVSELFCVDIHHRYMNTNIIYKNRKNSRKQLTFSSTGGHFVNIVRT